MRAILFRGLTLDTKEFVYGYYKGSTQFFETHHEITDAYNLTTDIIPETLGQYTGLKDKNGVMIFEGDILSDGSQHGYIVVHFCENSAAFVGSNAIKWVSIDLHGELRAVVQDYLGNIKILQIIGNIHQNNEFLK